MPEKDEEWNQDEVMKEDTEAAVEEIETTEVDESEVGKVSEADAITDDEAPLDEAETIKEEASIAGTDAVDEPESDEEAVSETETEEDVVTETPVFEAPKAKKKTNWTKILTGCALMLTLGGFVLFSQHLENKEAEQTAFEKGVWAEAYLETYEPVAYTFMDKAFLDEAANKDMKAWFDENEAKAGAYLYNIKGDEDYSYLLLSVGQQENNIIQLYDVSQAENGTLIMGYSLLDSESLGIEATTNTPTVFVRIAKTDAKVVARLIEETAPEELVKITTEEIEGEETALTDGAEKVAEDIKEEAKATEAAETEPTDEKETTSAKSE